MTRFSQIKMLVYKEVQLEWRNKYAFNGILLYIIGSVFICYMSFNVKRGALNPITWNALFWIIFLFSAINAVAKSFNSEREGRNLYYYTLLDPHALILAKIFYNSILLFLLGGLGCTFYSIVMGNPIQDLALFWICILLGSIGFSATLTLVSSIASKASNNGTLMAILSFPVVLPMVVLIIKTSKNAIDGLDWGSSYDELMVLAAINSIVLTTSYLLFPYLWRN